MQFFIREQNCCIRTSLHVDIIPEGAQVSRTSTILICSVFFLNLISSSYSLFVGVEGCFCT
jgi:hypothetical protein